MENMGRLYLLLFFAAFAIRLHGGTALGSSDVSSEPWPAKQTDKESPLDQWSGNPTATISIETKSYTPIATPLEPSTNKIQRQSRHSGWPFFPFSNPNIYFNPYFNPVSANVLKTLIDQYTNDLEMIKERQNLVLKYAECSTDNTDKCRKVESLPGDPRAANYWNWEYNRPDIEYVTADRFYAVMNHFKSSIEKLTLRQNMLYEYIQCSCMTKTECSSSIKPLLDIMFSNNGNVSGQLIHSLFVPGSSYNPASSFFQTLASYFSQIPSWFAFNFNPLASAFGAATSSAGSYQPYSTSSISSPSLSSSSVSSSVSSSLPSSSSSSIPTSTASHTTSSPQTTESNSPGSQPVYSSSSSYSSTSGSGQQISGGYVSTSGGGKPSEEQYFISSNGGNIQVSSSTDGSGSTVSYSTGKKPEVRRRRQVYIPSYGVNPGIAAAQVGLQAAQVGLQVGMGAAQQGIQASQIGISAAQSGINAAHLGLVSGIHATG